MTDGHEPAFALANEELMELHHGLTKREYLAIIVMKELLNNQFTADAPAKHIAKMSVEQADELIKELNMGTK